MQLTRDLVTALLLDLLGTLLLVLGILGYVGVIPPFSAPGAYLALGGVGLAATGLAMPLLLRALRAQKTGPR
ncbi:hypothetical protein [Thiohalocapsa sp. ML1]|jgi:hypothetical protein|uniref:hypothetical protein n=1 Tax=Thiohalocapsa sp. ML1 TaxID=1431688 RepID=UPI0007323839|nr:hypothetical protein [Thiohalocapsa sp. ML1]